MRSIGRRVLPALLALAFVAAVPAVAHAQVGVSGVVGIFGFGGDDFDGLDPGLGIEGGISARTSDAFSIGGVFHWSNHGIEDTEEDLTQISIMAQPLIHLGEPGETDVFFGARGGWTQIGDDVDFTGIIVGPVAGVGFPLGERTTFGVGGTFDLVSVDNSDTGGCNAEGDSCTGSNWGAGAFITVGLGGG